MLLDEDSAGDWWRVVRKRKHPQIAGGVGGGSGGASSAVLAPAASVAKEASAAKKAEAAAKEAAEVAAREAYGRRLPSAPLPPYDDVEPEWHTASAAAAHRHFQ